MYEAYVTVEHHGFDLEVAVARHHDHQLLCRGHDAADGVHRQLLDGAICWRSEELQRSAVLRLDKVFTEAFGLALRLDQFSVARASIFLNRLRPLLANCSDRRCRFVRTTLLDLEFVLLLDEGL